MTLPKNGVPAYAQESGDAPGEIDDHGWHLGHSHNDHDHHHYRIQIYPYQPHDLIKGQAQCKAH